MTAKKPKHLLNPKRRPEIYSIDLADKLCQLIVEGMSLNRICKRDDMPCIATVYNWIGKYPEFLEKYERAKEDQADTLVDEMLDIVDDGRNDWIETNDPDNPGYKANGEAIQRSRLRLDARKWLAAKLKAKKYGDSGTNINIQNNTQNNLIASDSLSKTKTETLLRAINKIDKENEEE